MKLHNSHWVVIYFSILIAGCMSPAVQQERQAERKAQMARDHQAMLQQVRERCEEYGFKPDTDGFAGCVQKDVQAREAAEQATSTRKSQISLCKSAMYARPTRTGSFAESAANAAKCDADPNAHLHEEKRPPSYTCKEGMQGSVNCDPR